MFPMYETSEPDALVAVPNSVNSLAIPTMLFQREAISDSSGVVAFVVVAAVAALVVVVATDAGVV